MTVYVQLDGGIGNQLFQYAAAILLQSVLKKQVFLNVSKTIPHSGRNYTRCLYSRIATAKSIPEMRTHVLYAYMEWDPDVFQCPYDILLLGCYQYLPTIEPVLPFVYADLHAYLAPYKDFIRKKYSIYDPYSVGFLHVRRGDYLTAGGGRIHWVQDGAYYTEGVKRCSNLSRWFVLSNDVEWCKAEPAFRAIGAEVVDEPDELYSLALMSLCHGGAVIANSTFSWWGAMLGAHPAGSTVVYPSKWTGEDNVQLFPSGWIRI